MALDLKVAQRRYDYEVVEGCYVKRGERSSVVSTYPAPSVDNPFHSPLVVEIREGDNPWEPDRLFWQVRNVDCPGTSASVKRYGVPIPAKVELVVAILPVLAVWVSPVWFGSYLWWLWAFPLATAGFVMGNSTIRKWSQRKSEIVEMERNIRDGQLFHNKADADLYAEGVYLHLREKTRKRPRYKMLCSAYKCRSQTLLSEENHVIEAEAQEESRRVAEHAERTTTGGRAESDRTTIQAKKRAVQAERRVEERVAQAEKQLAQAKARFESVQHKLDRLGQEAPPRGIFDGAIFHGHADFRGATFGGVPGTPVRVPDVEVKPKTTSPSPQNTTTWEKVVARHRVVREEYGAARSDLLSVLNQPLIFDLSSRKRDTFERALVTAEDSSRKGDLSAYGDAVTELEVAWEILCRSSRTSGDSLYDDDFKKRLRKARKLATKAYASPHLRDDPEALSSLVRAIELVESVLDIPQPLRKEIGAVRREAISR